MDYNANGIDDDNGVGVGNMNVCIISNNGTKSTTTTDNAGKFSFPNAITGNYRLEFSFPSSLNYLKPTPNGKDNGTLVQFIAAPNCTVSLGVVYPGDYCQANPPLVVPCYVNGDPLSTGSAKDSVVLLSVPFSVANAAPAANKSTILKAKDAGTLWGVGYNRTKKTIITTAALRRHAGFGSAGPGGIYFVDYSNFQFCF